MMTMAMMMMFMMKFFAAWQFLQSGKRVRSHEIANIALIILIIMIMTMMIMMIIKIFCSLAGAAKVMRFKV